MPVAVRRFISSKCTSIRENCRHRVPNIAITIVLGALGLRCCAGPSPAQTNVSRPSVERSGGIGDKDLDARSESILRRMTLEEKIGQLVEYSAGQPTGPGTGRTDYDDMIARGQIGSLFNVVDPGEINRYQKIVMEKSRLHIPIL